MSIAVELLAGQINTSGAVVSGSSSSYTSVSEKETTGALSGSTAGATGKRIYRMRGFDNTLSTTVYWTASFVDYTGLIYTGPGSLSNVIVSKRIS
jgi:hypothetical protein